jgi:hypothetical protein
VNLRARVAGIEPGRQRRDRLQRRQSAVLIDPVRDDAAALFTREIDKIKARMKAVVARPDEIGLRDLRRRVGNETSGLGVKAELYDRTSPWEGVRTTLGT